MRNWVIRKVDHEDRTVIAQHVPSGAHQLLSFEDVEDLFESIKEHQDVKSGEAGRALCEA